MIQLQSLNVQRGAKVLLDAADLTVYPGHKWGIIGPNGSGKSSLFQVLLGKLVPDGGSWQLPQGWQIAHMAQETDASSRTAINYVLDGDAELRELEQAIERSQDKGELLAKLYDQYDVIGGYQARSRAERLLHGLGFKPGDTGRPVTEFSGGWRIRLNLAQALMCRSDLLLLDEPTNHLDLDATLWLEAYLQSFSGTLLIISHDRDFLDNVVDGIISFEGTKLFQYRGNYSAFERQKAERLAQQAAAFSQQQARMSEIEAFVRRFRAKASKAKQAQSRLKELERMETIAPAHVDSPFSFKFSMPEKTSEQLITLTEAAIGYGATPLIAKAELNLLSTSRIGLLGPNGAGKSTLLKTLAGKVPMLAGKRSEGTHLRVGYFAQHQLEELDLNASCALHLQRLRPQASEQEIRNYLGGFAFRGDRAFENITHFSGGEKARLALAILAWQKPNLLLLDEPSNHLDLEMRHALSLALQTFEGAIVVVSHDRHLLRNTVDEFLLVDSGKVATYEGDMADYQAWLLQSQKESPVATGADSAAKIDKKGDRQAAAALREQLKPYTKAIARLEQQMEKHQSALKRIESQLLEPALYESGNSRLAELLKEQGAIKQQLEEVEMDWLEKSEHLEALKAAL